MGRHAVDGAGVHTVRQAPEAVLLRAVILRAIDDARGRGANAFEARRWLLGPGDGFMSCGWYCDLLGIDPARFRHQVAPTLQRQAVEVS